MPKLRLDERPAGEVRREIAQRRSRAPRSAPRTPRGGLEALARVVAGGPLGDQERPVGALERQQLAQRPLRRAGPSAARPSAGARPARRRRRAPRGQVAAACPSSSRGRSGAGSASPSSSSSGRSTLRHLDHRGQPRRPLVPEVAEQLGVERARPRAPLRASTKSRASARAWRSAPPRRTARRRSPTRGARYSVSRCESRYGAGSGSRRRSTRARSWRGRSARAAGRPASAAGAARPRSVKSTHAACTPASSSSSSSHGSYAHSGSHSPPPQAPKRARCAAIPVSSCRRTPASVASSGSTACVAADVQVTCGANARDEVAAPLERVRRARVARRRALEHRRDVGLAARGRARWVSARTSRRNAQAALERAGRLELVGEHGRERQRDCARARRRARRAAAGRRSRSPPTATPRRTATSRSPRRRACACGGRSPARRGSWPQHGQQVERAVEVARRSAKSRVEIAGVKRS